MFGSVTPTPRNDDALDHGRTYKSSPPAQIRTVSNTEIGREIPPRPDLASVERMTFTTANKRDKLAPAEFVSVERMTAH